MPMTTYSNAIIANRIRSNSKTNVYFAEEHKNPNKKKKKNAENVVETAKENRMRNLISKKLDDDIALKILAKKLYDKRGSVESKRFWDILTDVLLLESHVLVVPIFGGIVCGPEHNPLLASMAPDEYI